MSKSSFSFKEFTIYQDLAAMKVGTDGVLLGAWTDVNQASRVLDIGCGTGVIGLMLAQRNPSLFVDAIDIDEGAYEQTVINFNNSKWSDRLKTFNASLQEFETISNTKYDCIVCNPPYFTHGKRSGSLQKRRARHNDQLPFDTLTAYASQLLSTKGKFSVIIPKEHESEFIRLCSTNLLFPLRTLKVKPNLYKEYNRLLIEFTFEQKNDIGEDVLVLEEFGRHRFSMAYKKLMQDFQKEEYLK